MKVEEILNWFESQRSEVNIAGMKRFGIVSDKMFGVSLSQTEILRKQIKKDHELAVKLWDTGYHEARHLAALIAEPKIITEATVEKWVNDFDNWAICDSVCGKLFQKIPVVYDKIEQWHQSDKLYVKRASFSLIAWIAVHHKKLPDSFFRQYFDLIILHAEDDRNYVKKAVNWALRQIGKRNSNLAIEALEICDILKETYPLSKSAKWIANDAEREINIKFKH